MLFEKIICNKKAAVSAAFLLFLFAPNVRLSKTSTHMLLCFRACGKLLCGKPLKCCKINDKLLYICQFLKYFFFRVCRALLKALDEILSYFFVELLISKQTLLFFRARYSYVAFLTLTANDHRNLVTHKFLLTFHIVSLLLCHK